MRYFIGVVDSHDDIVHAKTRTKTVGSLLVVLPVSFQIKYTLFFFFLLFVFSLSKNVVFPTQAEYSYFSADFRLKIFLYYS